MSCRICQKHLPDYRENELTAAVRAQMQAHLNDCAACRQRLAELDAALSAFRALRPPAAPPSLRESFYQRLAQEQARGRRWAFGAAWVVMGCLVVGLFGGWLGRGNNRRARNPFPPKLAVSNEHRRAESPSPPSFRNPQSAIRNLQWEGRDGDSALRSRRLPRAARIVQTRTTHHAPRTTHQPSPSYILIIVHSAPEPEQEVTPETTVAYHVELTRGETGERSVVGFERVMEGDKVKSLAVHLGQGVPESEKPRSEEVEHHEKKLG